MCLETSRVNKRFRHGKLEVETVNEHALLYTWQGSDHELKPLLFMAHSDVRLHVHHFQV
jgi:hypothetical protein